MYLYVIILIVVMLLVPIARSVRKSRRKAARIEEARKQRRDKMLNWCEAVEATSDDAQLSVLCGSIPAVGWLDVSDEEMSRRRAAEIKVGEARRREETIKRSLSERKRYESEPSPAARAIRCWDGLKSSRDLDLLIAYDADEVGVNALIAEYVKDALDRIRQQDDTAEIKGLRVLRHSASSVYDGHLTALEEELNVSDWNDLVARLVKTPALGDFNASPQLQSGVVRLLAAEALRVRSLVQAKIVLAYCDSRHGQAYRNEIGDVLLAELAKLVDRLHAERGVFATN